MKLFLYTLRPFDELAFCEKFSAEYGIEFASTPAAPCPENLALADGFDAVSTTPCAVPPEYVRAWADMGVKYLPCRSIGFDHLPLDTARELGLRVAHSSYPPDAVANYAVMLMLMCTRKMNQIMLRAAVQDYSLPGKLGRDISGCTVGVVGTGKIGRRVIRSLSGFGCRILAYDLYPSGEAAGLAEYVTLDTLLRRSDIVTLHLNATPQNRHIIDEAAVQKMKPGAFLVNTARGTLIDPEALIRGLESGHLGGAGLDVVENENALCYYNLWGKALDNRELNLLRSMPNVIVSPHTAFYTDVSIESMVRAPFAFLDDAAHGRENSGEVRL